MREVEKPEVTVMHCIWCGCKNKVKTDYGVPGEEPVGFTLRCCNCGHMDFFNRNWSKPMDLYTSKYSVLNMTCVKDQRCDHKECPLYTTNLTNNKDSNTNLSKKNVSYHTGGYFIRPKKFK